MKTNGNMIKVDTQTQQRSNQIQLNDSSISGFDDKEGLRTLLGHHNVSGSQDKPSLFFVD